MRPVIVLQLLIVLMLANGAPLIAKKFFGERYSYPLDGNVLCVDSRPVFGRSKTMRGIVLAGVATTAAASVIGLHWEIGLLVCAFAMAGDLFSSLQTALVPADEQPGRAVSTGFRKRCCHCSHAASCST